MDTQAVVETLMAEGMIGPAAVARLIGGKTHPVTVSRWCLRGIRLPSGKVLKLEHARVGPKLMTSQPAVARFLAAQTEVSGTDVPAVQTPTQRKRAADRAAAELDALGV